MNNIEKYKQLLKRLNALDLAITSISYDSSTIGPKNGSSYRNENISYLAGEYFETLYCDETVGLLKALSEEELPFDLEREITYRLEDVTKFKSIPKDRYIAYSLIMSSGQDVWAEAKEKNDYSIFEPTLNEIVEISKEIYSYRQTNQPLYNEMLDDYERGSTIEFYDSFFSKIKSELVPLLKQQKTQKFPWANKTFSIDKQKQVIEVLVDYLKFDRDSLYIGESLHPFSSTFSIQDARITNRYFENDFASSIFSLIHELGHATYNSQVDLKYQGMYIANNMSSGMHESQSRFFENYLARSTGFWEVNYPKIKEIYKEELAGVELEDFIAYINYAHPSLIRVEADELSYSLHILIRYEIEKGLFDGTYTTKGLDKVWNQKYQEYFGFENISDADGILQDIHWSGCSFGYFPTYALGSAYGAQFLHQIKKDLELSKLLKENRFEEINAWLKEKIHRDGGIYTPEEIIFSVTGEKFNPDYYINYLKDKFATNN